MKTNTYSLLNASVWLCSPQEAQLASFQWLLLSEGRVKREEPDLPLCSADGIRERLDGHWSGQHRPLCKMKEWECGGDGWNRMQGRENVEGHDKISWKYIWNFPFYVPVQSDNTAVWLFFVNFGGRLHIFAEFTHFLTDSFNPVKPDTSKNGHNFFETEMFLQPFNKIQKKKMPSHFIYLFFVSFFSKNWQLFAHNFTYTNKFFS